MEQLQKLDYQNKLQQSSHSNAKPLFDQGGAADKPAVAGAVSAAAMSAVLSSEIARHKKIDDQDEQ